MSGYQTIRYERRGHIGTLTLARPAKRNAQNPLMWQELATLMQSADNLAWSSTSAGRVAGGGCGASWAISYG